MTLTVTLTGASRRRCFSLSMIPFCYVVFTLLVGLGETTDKQVPSMAGLISSARLLTAVSWCMYPVVYAVKSMGLSGTTATMYEQIGEIQDGDYDVKLTGAPYDDDYRRIHCSYHYVCIFNIRVEAFLDEWQQGRRLQHHFDWCPIQRWLSLLSLLLSLCSDLQFLYGNFLNCWHQGR